MEQNLFDDIMEALHEVEEHQKGNIKLRSTVVTLPPDEERETVSMFYNLSEKNKRKAMIFINELYQQREA
jgi:hypothetical protein